MTGLIISLEEAARFLWEEADLLDRKAYQDWLELWADNGLYIVPKERDVADHAAVLNYAYDDAAMRDMRVRRLTSVESQSAQHAARTVRTISRFVEVERGENQLRLRAAQHIAEYHRDIHRVIPADLDITLLRTQSGLKFSQKIVTLINCEDALPGIGYLL